MAIVFSAIKDFSAVPVLRSGGEGKTPNRAKCQTATKHLAGVNMRVFNINFAGSPSMVIHKCHECRHPKIKLLRQREK